MIKISAVNAGTKDFADPSNRYDKEAIANFNIPHSVDVFEIIGPLFFVAAYKFKDAMKFIEKAPKILILRMRQVPIIDATGVRTLKDVYEESKLRGTKLVLSEVNSEQVIKELKDSRLLFNIGKANMTNTFTEALDRCKNILSDLH